MSGKWVIPTNKPTQSPLEPTPPIPKDDPLSSFSTNPHRWQFQMCLNWILITCVVLSFFWSLGAYVLWRVDSNGVMVTSHTNVSIKGEIESVVPGVHVPLVPLNKEEEVSTLSFTNINTTTAVISSVVRAEGGYRNFTNGQLVFSTTNNDGETKEAMRIDNNQKVGIGVEEPIERLHVNGSIVYNGALINTCDIEEKINVSEMKDVYRDVIKKVITEVTPKWFARKHTPEHIELGFIAQDFVGKDLFIASHYEDDLFRIDNNIIIAYLWTNQQSLLKEIEELKRQIN